jgi:hypothetical protein
MFHWQLDNSCDINSSPVNSVLVLLTPDTPQEPQEIGGQPCAFLMEAPSSNLQREYGLADNEATSPSHNHYEHEKIQHSLDLVTV